MLRRQGQAVRTEETTLLRHRDLRGQSLLSFPLRRTPAAVEICRQPGGGLLKATTRGINLLANTLHRCGRAFSGLSDFRAGLSPGPQGGATSPRLAAHPSQTPRSIPPRPPVAACGGWCFRRIVHHHFLEQPHDVANGRWGGRTSIILPWMLSAPHHSFKGRKVNHPIRVSLAELVNGNVENRLCILCSHDDVMQVALERGVERNGRNSEDHLHQRIVFGQKAKRALKRVDVLGDGQNIAADQSLPHLAWIASKNGVVPC